MLLEHVKNYGKGRALKTGFEYETNMILYFIENKINIVEEKIECVYINENKNTNYKPMKDTIRIGKIILRRK